VHELADRLNDDAGVAGCDQRGGLRAARHDLRVDLVRDSEPREELGRQVDAAGARRDSDHPSADQCLPEGLDRADVRLGCPRAHGHAESGPCEVDVGRSEDWPAAISSARPSLERIVTSAGIPRPSWAAMVSGPFPWEEPERVVTVMPVERSNSGRTCRYAVENPPEMITLSCARAGIGVAMTVASAATSTLTKLGRMRERAFIIPALFRAHSVWGAVSAATRRDSAP